MGLFGRFARKLLYGGSKLQAHERAILNAVSTELPAKDRAAFEQQMASIETIQRFHGGRMVTFHFAPMTPLLSFKSVREEHCLARIRLRGSSGPATALVISHKGRLSSLEFKKSPASLRAAPFEVHDVFLDVEDSGISKALDRLEHGWVDEESG